MLYPTQRTNQEVLDSWYNSKDLAGFKNERLKTVTQLKRSGFDTKRIGSKYCLRGFEPYFSLEMNKATKLCRDLVVHVVLVEQNRQRMHGSLDTELLRDRCANASKWARNNAHELGTLDARLIAQESQCQNQCIGLPYCQNHASCLLATSPSQHTHPSHIDLVDSSTVVRLQKAVREIKALM